MSILGIGLGLAGSLLGIGGQAKADAQARRDARALTEWQNETDKRNYEYNLQVREYEFDQANRIYKKSQDIYDKQLYQNNVAVSRSYLGENQKMDEYLQELAFNKQDLFTKMIQESGKFATGGAQGRSTANSARGVLSQYGRNSAILAENLVSRERQQRQDFATLNIQKQQADIDALEKLGLKPQKPPAPPLPIPRPGASGGSNTGLQVGQAVVSSLSTAVGALGW